MGLTNNYSHATLELSSVCLVIQHLSLYLNIVDQIDNRFALHRASLARFMAPFKLTLFSDQYSSHGRLKGSHISDRMRKKLATPADVVSWHFIPIFVVN